MLQKLDVIPGWKTILTGVVAILGAFAVSRGWITQEFLDELQNYLLGAGLITVRLAIMKLGRQ